MSPLERKIKAAALWEIRRMTKDDLNGYSRYLRFAYQYDGVIGFIDYDREVKTFEVEYYLDNQKRTFKIPKFPTL